MQKRSRAERSCDEATDTCALCSRCSERMTCCKGHSSARKAAGLCCASMRDRQGPRREAALRV
eukprot:1300617-Prorocentrum_lima.AAC.1